RFPLQARGTRLVVGTGVLLAGALVTAVVILSGHNTEGLQAQPILGPQGMWTLFQASLVLLWVGGGIWLWTMEAERKAERRLLLGAEIGLFLVLVVLFWQGRSMQIGESSMRILWQLMQGTFAGLVLLAACLLLFKRRGGVVLIHMAVALLMFGQWMVSQYDVESRITIEEGQTVNFTRDIRSTELAVIDTSGKDEDHVVVIPLNVNGRDSSFLRTSEPIQHEDLPFRVEIVNYFKNARIRKAEGDETSPVTAGGSIGYIADAERASSGADSSGEVDFAAAYVKFIDTASDKSLGTYLLTQVLSEQEIAEEVVVGDEDSDESKTYHVALRFRRDYKPYSLHLVDVRKDDYMGTSTPRNYSSEVWLVDPTRGENRPVKIWMNNPLRFAGETFYQSGYRVDPRLGKEITDLQVVKNYGWMIPYVACMLAVVGMLAHFTMTLVRYIERAQRESTSRAIAGNSQVIAAQLADDDKSSHSPKTKREKKRRKDQGAAPELLGNQMAGFSGASSAVLMASVGAALLMVLLAGGFLAGRAKRPSYEGNAMNLYEAGKLPVMYQGRMKPLDTLARNSLRMITNNRETFKDQAGDRQPAIRWLLDTISGSDAAREHQVFYIHHPDVLTTLGLERRKSHLYSVEELLPNIARFEEQVSEARKLPTEQLDDYQRQLLVLDRRIRTFTLISAAFRPLPFPEFPTQEEYEADKEAATQKLFQIKQMMDAAPEAEQELMRMEPPLVIPALTSDGQWSSYGPAWNKAYLQREVLKEDVNPATQSWAS
ncbi:MAG: cytochrome c biogenesis protein ResB, partial [Planctomycetales bacterium]|nr:cytochrome c biogenesis protein ResB [Planctomycetales bacterium]